jgi:glycosyltransferase involved in cell wall biosynthesis
LPSGIGVGFIDVILNDNPETPDCLERFRLFAIVCAWMEADVIGATVANAFSQGCDRVYLIDNDSPDDTIAVAERAGATLYRKFSTARFEEELRFDLMNENVAEISARERDEHIWWLWLDADEFPHGSRGRTVREHLSSLDRRFRVVGSRFFNHYPSGPPHYVRGRHPLDFQPLCEEFAYPMCSGNHRKHSLQRFDRGGPAIRCGLGIHTAASTEKLIEPTDPIFLHHFPFREEHLTRKRLLALHTKGPDGLERLPQGQEATGHMYARFRSLDAVYRGDWANVENFMTEPVSRGVVLAPWDAQAGARDAPVARWHSDDEGGSGNPQRPLLSVCVCTRNRAVLLARCLESLLPAFDASRIEVIVVDNGSRNDTHIVVQSFTARSEAIRYVRESAAGLSHARNRGWCEARGRYVGYIDDDAVARDGWLATALEIATTRGTDAFGGPYFAYYDSLKPGWYRDENYSHVQGGLPRHLGPGEYLDGTNFFVCRERLEALGGFDTTLGMQGDSLSYGEETELLDRLRRSVPGACIWYDPRLVVDHLVPAYKMRLSWIARSAVAEGRVNYVLFEKPSQTGWRFRALRAVSGLLTDSVTGLVSRDRSRYPLIAEYLYERTLVRCRDLGAALEQGRRQSARFARKQPDPAQRS